MTKAQVRTYYKRKRDELDSNEKLNREGKLYARLGETDLLSGKNAHCFLSIKRFNEIDTFPLMQWEGISWILSKTTLGRVEMKHFEYDANIPFEFNDWEIPEPAGGKIVSEQSIDVVLVPLLAFNLDGHRVGYGKGYYDNFLSKCRPDCIKIGLSLFDEAADVEGIAEHDIPLNMILTPNLSYYF